MSESRRAPVNAPNASANAAADTEPRREIGRRALLRAGAFAAGASLAGIGASAAAPAAAQDAAAQAGSQAGAASIGSYIIGEDAPPWMKTPGRSFSPYGAPSHWEEKVQRAIPSTAAVRLGVGVSRTPLEQLAGTITPSGLHFERHHNGIPDIDPARHELVIHGLVRQPLAFTRETLLRYPLESQIYFVECAGNSGTFSQPQPQQAAAGALNGLVSCSQWTGVRLSTLLDEAGIQRGAKWVIAEGADAAAMSRSVPLEKCLDDAMIALFQNGEAIRPEQGYPMRLLLPGFEGNINVKWLRRLNVIDAPVDARDETSHYTELLPDGKARQYMFLQGVKSAIIKPSFGMNVPAPGFYEISGLAWSGAGRISEVELSTNGGKSWTARRARPARFAQGARPLSSALAMGRPPRDPHEPRHRREGQRPAHALGLGRAVRARPALSLQRHSELERRRRRDGAKCLRLGARAFRARHTIV